MKDVRRIMEDYLVQDPEIEYLDERAEISVPFDPNAIRIATTPLNLGDILERVEHDEIKLDTEFQRRFVWKLERQSQFIESLLLRLPVSTFYFDGGDDNKWRIIDGLQRISTVKRFVLDQSLALTGMEFLKQFEGKCFGDLPRDLQRRIRTFPITAYIVEKGTPDEVKYNIFSRVNRGGLVLKAQEIRHALFQERGASDFIRDLAEHPSFLTATSRKIQTERMEDRDFVTRFVAFAVLGYQSYQPDMDTFMTKGMEVLKGMPETGRQRLKSVFIASMECIFSIFGDDAFRKRTHPQDVRKPINKALFEVLSVQIAALSNEQQAMLIGRGEQLKARLMAHMQSGQDFLRSITVATAGRESVAIRHAKFQEMLTEVLS
ncbi:MAG: DUF262 domain-containing protein [Bacteroidia bacterium]|nr:DUF262 domain-containing protein [Bacteroidia bacterium]